MKTETYKNILLILMLTLTIGFGLGLAHFWAKYGILKEQNKLYKEYYNKTEKLLDKIDPNEDFLDTEYETDEGADYLEARKNIIDNS